MKKPGVVTVYLDSSDYSRLSSPKASRDELRIRDELLELSREPNIEFRYSGAHVCEMAPLQSAFTQSALSRTELMVRLCGKKCFRPIDVVFQEEKKSYRNQVVPTEVIYSETGDWFSDIEGALEPLRKARENLTDEFRNQAAAMGINRQARRLLSKKVITERGLRPEMEQKFRKNAEKDTREILEAYPMRPADALILSKYLRGQASDEQASAALLSSLRDPIWMTSWFYRHFDKLSFVINWLRNPANEMFNNVNSLSEDIRAMRSKNEALGRDPRRMPGFDDIPLESRVRELSTLLMNKLGLKDFSGREVGDGDLEILAQYAPGLFTMAGTFSSAAWASFSATPRQPLKSDFIDATHALYAPYVDVFRTDAFMTPLVRKFATKYGTNVVSSLADVTPTIRSALNSKPAS